MDDFFAAIEAGDIAAVRAYLERDRSLANAVDSRPWPQRIGSERRRSGLPEEPAKPRKPRTSTALQLAIARHPDIARLLLDFGAEVNGKALHFAIAIWGPLDLDLIQVVVERGADVNARAQYGDTPLTRAFRWFWDEHPVVEFLLAHGADVNLPGQRGRTPLDRALALLGSPAIDHVRMVSTLLRYGAEVNPVRLDENGHSPPICEAAFHGNLNVAHLLIEAGADVNASSRWGTPLHHAAERGNGQLVELLLAAGADPSSLDPRGRAPLELIQPYEHLLSQVERWLED